MGTPDFAVVPLERLIAEGQDVVGVFTQPDKPKGRKHVLTPPPVKVCALEHDIPVFQPESLKHGEAMPVLNDLQPDLIVVAAYGMLLKSDVLEFPKYGCVNVHASLLPKYRGAAPINRCILDGETVTGVTTMLMNEGLDTGDMLCSASLTIGADETAGELFDRLAALGGDVLMETLAAIENGTLTRTPQTDENSCYAGMLSKSDSPIDWTRSAQDIHNQVRGLQPWPTAVTSRGGEPVKVHATCKMSAAPSGAAEVPGALAAEKGQLFVRCGDGRFLEVLEIQPQGSRRMAARDYLLGHPVSSGDVFE